LGSEAAGLEQAAGGAVGEGEVAEAEGDAAEVFQAAEDRFGGPVGRAWALETLPDHDEAELVQAGERDQVSSSEGSVKHVEVFRMSGVGTFILGRPRPLASHRRAHAYTLNREDPLGQPDTDHYIRPA